MTAEPPRIGLVLGAGGVAGGAFHAGVLAALHEAMGWDARRAHAMIGTSAGAIATTSLRAGLSPADMLARTEGRVMSPAGASLMSRMRMNGEPMPLRPALQTRRPAQIANAIANAATRPFSAPPWALMAGLLPEGSISTDFISDAVASMFPDDWPEALLWICAVRQADGRRTVFGRESRPALAAAVAASCAIPAFFRPVVIDDEAYVDGGLHSPTNADLMVEAGADLVIVSSPMSMVGPRIRLGTSQAVRRWAGALLDTEALRLKRRKIAVVAFQPTVEDLVVMGVNAMDPANRAAIARQARESTLRRLARDDTRARLEALVA
jgi:NTE family protein